MSSLVVSSPASQRSHPIVKVLLIEDTETDQVVYARYLKADLHYEYALLSAVTLFEGMSVWQSQSPDVVLLDMNLPDGDGLEFLEFLQAEWVKEDLQTKAPVIVLTGQGNERVAVQAMKLGAIDYLVKGDLTAIALQKSVRSVIEYQFLALQLTRSQQQKALLAEISWRIRESLDLPQILQSAVDGVRQLLGCDRAVIYQFQADWSGTVVVESVCTQELAILHQEIFDPCFASNWHEPYRQGKINYISDLDEESLKPCYVELLASLHVRANLVIPILQNDQLWGLLIAHECHQPRNWEVADIRWVQQLAIQASIAIQQATAYAQLQVELRDRQQAEAQLQQLNQELEDRVAQRTADLQQREAQLRFQADILQDIRDAVVATDANGLIESWNHGAEKIFGYRAEEMIGQNVSRLYQQPEEVPSIITCLLANNRNEVEVACRAKSGARIDIHLRLTVKRDEQGEIIRLLGVSHDISATKRSEAARQQAEQENQLLRERLQFILSSSPAVLYTCHAENMFQPTFVSNNITAHLGYTPDELMHQPNFWLDCVHPDDRPKVLAEISQVYAQGYQSLEYRIRHQNGEYRWIQDEFKLVCAASGAPCELVGYFVDISDRHVIQAQLQSLSDRLTMALESADIGTWDWDLNNEAQWDRHMYALYGLQDDQHPITYTNWLNRLHPDDRDRTVHDFQLALVLGKLDSEFRIVWPDSSIRYIQAMGLMYYDPMGQPRRMVGINYDITARKQSEEALIRYTGEVEDLYNNAPCGYHSLDFHGHLIRVNETELQWLGYTREEMVGRSVTEFLTEESQQLFGQQYPIFRERGWLKDLELEMICKDGTILPVLENATAVRDAMGHYLHSRSTILEIRDRKQFEQQLRQTNAELLRATRLKDEFLANMSHELRTPLNAILGLSESLQEQILGTLNERQSNAIATIESSGQHLLELINDILDLSKISSGKMELVRTPTSVLALCQSSLMFVKQIALQKGIHLASHITADLTPVIADERRIRQVLINLLTNAVKFTPAGGQVTLDVTWQIKHDLAPPPGDPTFTGACWLLFSVIDTGIGIDAADLPRLFQPFVQIDSSLNRQQSGTGLGLAMVKQITELHEGWVTVDSHAGKGSSFTVALPYHPSGAVLSRAQTVPEEVAPELTVDPSTTAIAPRILLAEDNEANVATFKGYLTIRNYHVTVANDGADAIRLAQLEPPDLILMDIQMPGMDGLEAIRLIRADERLAHIPIIALTALAMPEDEARCLLAGANDYLSKPVKLMHLVAAIQKCLLSRQIGSGSS